MEMDGEKSGLKRNLIEWRFSQYPKYILLPIDENHDQTRVSVKNVVFSEAAPRPLVRNIKLVCYSEDVLMNILDMDPDICNKDEFAEFIAGRKLPCGSLPIAHRYGGHQYGLWVGQLGDGRAHILGEYVNRLGQRWQLQLKGSGQTPYARIYDGRTVLRAAIREMVASEACHYLGIPTTRTAAIVGMSVTFSEEIPDSLLTTDEMTNKILSQVIFCEVSETIPFLKPSVPDISAAPVIALMAAVNPHGEVGLKPKLLNLK